MVNQSFLLVQIFVPLVKTAEKETAKPESLSVAYGQTFVYETGKSSCCSARKADQLPQTGTEEEWIGILWVRYPPLVQPLFWKKRKKMSKAENVANISKNLNFGVE